MRIGILILTLTFAGFQANPISKPDSIHFFKTGQWILNQGNTLYLVDGKGKSLKSFQAPDWIGIENIQVQSNLRIWISHPLHGFIQLDNKLNPLSQFSWQDFGLFSPKGFIIDMRNSPWTLDPNQLEIVELSTTNQALQFRLPIPAGLNPSEGFYYCKKANQARFHQDSSLVFDFKERKFTRSKLTCEPSIKTQINNHRLILSKGSLQHEIPLPKGKKNLVFGLGENEALVYLDGNFLEFQF